MLEVTTATYPRRQRVALVVNIVVHSLYVLSLPVWYFISMFSVMLFDTPGSHKNIPIVAFYYAIECYPYMTIGAVTLSWLFYKQGFYSITHLINFLPAAVVLLCTGMMAYFGP